MGNKERADKKNASWVLGAVFIVICFILGIFLGWLMGGMGIQGKRGLVGGLTALAGMILILVAGCYAQILLHEVGHLVAGLLSGYQFVSFRIGSFLWMRRDGKLRVFRYFLPGTGGQCLMRPPVQEDLLHPDFPVFLYNMGGVMANLIASALGFFTFAFSAVPVPIRIGSLCFAVAGVLLAAANGLARRGRLPNDGMNAVSLKKDPEALYGFWIQLESNAGLAEGKRLRDMPAEWFYLPEKEKLGNVFVGATGYLYCLWLRDCGRYDEAAHAMDVLLAEGAGLLPVYQKELRCERLFDGLAGGGSAEEWKSWDNRELRAYRKMTKQFLSRQRLDYAWALLVEGNEKKAAEIRTQFERTAQHYPYEGEAASEREAMRRVEEKYERERGGREDCQ